MESVDRAGIAKALYPALHASGMSPRAIGNVIAASEEGFAFPTNLDRDPPIGDLAPQTQAQLMGQALAEGWEAAKFAAAVDEHAARRLT